MKKYFCQLFLILFLNAQSQQVLLLDSIQKKPIPFVNIKINQNQGTYSDENGYFEINKKVKDTLFLTNVSFNDIQFLSSEFKDTIYMSPNAISLKEVSVFNNKKQTK